MFDLSSLLGVSWCDVLWCEEDPNFIEFLKVVSLPNATCWEESFFFFFHFTLLSPFQILIDCGCGGLFRGSLVCSIILHVCIRVKVKFLKSVSWVELSLSQKDTFKPKSLIPWNVILFGNGVSAEKIKPKWSSQNEP